MMATGTCRRFAGVGKVLGSAGGCGWRAGPTFGRKTDELLGVRPDAGRPAVGEG